MKARVVPSESSDIITNKGGSVNYSAKVPVRSVKIESMK